MFQSSVDDVILHFLSDRVKHLSGELNKSDILFMMSPMYDGLDTSVRQYIEDINDMDAKTDNLTVILETTGGSVEVVERLVRIFRKHYKTVDFIIPNFAYSAGTVLVLSGDEIYMDYFSVLGPIDPQIRNKDGEWLPANGYLHKYQELIDTINSNDEAGFSSQAEINLLVNLFSPEKLAFVEQSNQFAKNLIKDWLPKYKFKNWDVTSTKETDVTEEMKIKRAEDIADILGDVNKWHMHGRGIGINELTSEKIKLKIQNFAENDSLNTAIRLYYDVLTDYLMRSGFEAALHGNAGIKRLG